MSLLLREVVVTAESRRRRCSAVGYLSTTSHKLEEIAASVYQHFLGGTLDIDYLNSLLFPSTRVAFSINPLGSFPASPSIGSQPEEEDTDGANNEPVKVLGNGGNGKRIVVPRKSTRQAVLARSKKSTEAKMRGGKLIMVSTLRPVIILGTSKLRGSCGRRRGSLLRMKR